MGGGTQSALSEDRGLEMLCLGRRVVLLCCCLMPEHRAGVGEPSERMGAVWRSPFIYCGRREYPFALWSGPLSC